ncbi:NAD(P)-dependent dehydrogenase [Candidatus Saccharibacteria bacterium 32-45-3]|nr:MAG: NAD(P)-dependent dehydrogenase [Candidatus Saccharibacteria bacterium 32-45-3]
MKGRKALITGGDSGIGAAVAIAYAREGADVAISYLDAEQEDAEHVKKYIEEAGQRAILIPGDIKTEGACVALAEKARTELGGIDILVNNAAKQVWSDSIENLSSAQFEATFQVNVFAMFWLTKALIPYMPKGATIINTTSIQSYQPSATLLDYATTKGAITAFTHALGAQLAPRGIRVNGVAPGPIWTPLQVSDGQPKKKLTEFGQSTPLGRPGQPAEVAPTYVFLASQESSYVTAEIIGVTGGHHTP